MNSSEYSEGLECVLVKIHDELAHVGNALYLAVMWILDAAVPTCQQVLNNLFKDVLSGAFHAVKSTVEWGQDVYFAQLQQTPLTVKACIVSLMIALMAVVVVILRRHRNIAKITEDTTILNVFDMAKTAYELGHVDALIDLVKKRNFDINYPLPNSGLSLFLCACLSGQRKLIQFLLKKGADIRQKTHDGDTALYLATFGSMSLRTPDTYTVGVILDLIAAGCDVNSQNNKGYTALHRAASRGNINVIRCLLKHGADPYQTTSTGIYPIDLATNAGHLDAAELLVIELEEPFVWDVVEPHTPSRVRLGLMSPQRKHLVESTAPRTHSAVIRRT